DEIVDQAASSHPDTFELAVSNLEVQRIYWDFESFLSEISMSLDLLARVVSPAFKQESPPSFNRLCKWAAPDPLVNIFRQAQSRWVKRMKDYRDCFTHYTPVDTLLSVGLRRYPDAWEYRAKLPINPNVREIMGFRYNRRTELLRYAIKVRKDMALLDRRVAA